MIALVSDAIFPYHRGGKEIRYHELSRRLAEHAEIHVYTMHWWEGPRVRKDEAVTLHAISPLLSMYTHNRRSLRQAIFFALACVRLLAARFDVLEADHMPYLQIFVLRLVASVKRKRFVVTWHEVWGKSYWRQYLGWAGYAAWFVEELAMRLPDHIIAASPHTAERLCASLGARASITVAPNGIDLEAVRASYPDPSTTDLVVVSRLIAHKRIGMLLDAMALLHAQGMPVTCRIIGDGPEREALRDQARAWTGVGGGLPPRRSGAERGLFAGEGGKGVRLPVSSRRIRDRCAGGSRLRNPSGDDVCPRQPRPASRRPVAARHNLRLHRLSDRRSGQATSRDGWQLPAGRVKTVTNPGWPTTAGTPRQTA